MGRRGHSEAIFALAVPAWHRTVHRTVFYRNYGKVRCDNYGSTPYFNKYGAYRTDRHRTAPYNSTSLIPPLIIAKTRLSQNKKTYIPYLFDNTPHKYCFLPCVYLYYCNILFVFIPILTLRDCAGFVISTLSGSLLVMNSCPPPRPLSHSTKQPEPQQQQQKQPQPQHWLLPMVNSSTGFQTAATAEQQLASNSPSQQAKAEQAELLAEEAAIKRPIGRP